MSKSFTSFLSEISSAGSGIVTRALGRSGVVVDSQLLSGDAVTGGGYIEPNARHWAIESYLPIDSRDLAAYLVQRSDANALDVASFQNAMRRIRSSLALRSSANDERFDGLYHAIDPDQDNRRPASLEAVVDPESLEAKPAESTDELLALCCEILVEAGYREVTRPEIEACVGVASQWGVPLHVEFSMFKQLTVYCRGDVIGKRIHRRWRKLYRVETIEVAVYQRMAVMFQLRQDIPGDELLLARSLHLRLFKNIPKQDIDMLLPCTKVKFTWLDRFKIVVPSIGGILMSARKIINTILIVAVLTLKSTFVLVGLVIAAVGYIVRSVLGYFQTKNRYLLNLTRSLYFQKLDTNAGVGYQMIHQAREQGNVETVLAYYALATAAESLSHRKWQRRCERIVREAIDLEVDFNIDRAASRLRELGLSRPDASGDRWLACSPDHSPRGSSENLIDQAESLASSDRQ